MTNTIHGVNPVYEFIHVTLDEDKRVTERLVGQYVLVTLDKQTVDPQTLKVKKTERLYQRGGSL